MKLKIDGLDSDFRTGNTIAYQLGRIRLADDNHVRLLLLEDGLHIAYPQESKCVHRMDVYPYRIPPVVQTEEEK